MVQVTYRYGQLPEVIRPNETIKSTSIRQPIGRVEPDGVLPVKVAVCCFDILDSIRLAWAMDGKSSHKVCLQPQALGIKDLFKTFYPEEDLKTKTQVNS